MALHQRTHPLPVDGCFGCKAIGISFATVPGAYRDSVSNARIDMESIERDLSDADGNPIFSRDVVEDSRSNALTAIREFNEAGA